MRLQSSTDSAENSEINEFSEWLLKVGEGKLSEPNDGYADIDIPDELLITDYEDPIKAIVESTFPDLLQKYKQPDFLQSRAILASTIEVVDQINNYVLDLIPGNYILKLSFIFVSIII
jgi:ATP-dependent DNA helicase PIF1